jgi:pyruvate/2-oxoglutarate dehydrogenase complex dihydrolipoamide dehydrogenase (E3) component
MKKPYDLIIISNAFHSYLVAEYAASLGARVGLIKLLPHNKSSFFFDVYDWLNLTKQNYLSYQNLLQEKQNYFSLQIIPQLSKQGVHLINSHVQFNRGKKLHLTTTNDVLIAPNYLLTGNKDFNISTFNHQLNFNVMTIAQLIIEDKWGSLPDNVGIFGNSILAIYLAIRLQSSHKNVTLFTENNCLLPHEDEDVSWYLQLYLEAKGIKIYYHKSFDNYDLFLARDTEYQLIITDAYEQKINEQLDLARLGIKSDRHGIKVNSKLQTNHPQIYACGNILRRYPLDNIAEYEAKIAVQNALFFPWQKIDYNKIPYCLKTQPALYRLGYTEKQARSSFKDRIKVINLFPRQNNFLLDNEQNIYYLKIIVDRHNYILGCHCLGLTKEIFTAITIMVKNKQPLPYLFKFNFVESHSIQLIKELKIKWQKENYKKNDMINNLRETFLIWKNNLV